MKQHPISIWLVIAFLAYSIVSTLLGLAGALSGAPSYTPEILVASIVVSALSVWLIAELWWDGPRKRPASIIIWIALVVVQILAYLQFVPDPLSQLSGAEQRRTVLIFSGVVAVLFGLIPLAVFRHEKAKR